MQGNANDDTPSTSEGPDSSEKKWSVRIADDYMEERARRGSREKFLAALAKVPSVEPSEEDRWT